MDEMKLKEYQPFWNNWYIDSLIGEGSFGSVYKIVREEFGEKYYSALKIISIPKTQNEVKRVRFEGLDDEGVSLYFRGMVEDIYKEIILMTRLKGKTYIVSYEDHEVVERKDEIGFDIFIRMELLQGLNEYAMNNPMSVLQVVRLGKDICRALMLCQKHNIMHRDIKPDNIFVSSDGDFKLGDFGIARQAEKTQGGLSIKGSYEYMAPEVYLGKEYDFRVDIYSLGIVLYTFLNCKKIPLLPLDSMTTTHKERQEALRNRFQGAEIPKPIMASEALGEVVLKAIAYDPQERYTTAVDFFHALNNLKSEDLMAVQEDVPFVPTPTLREDAETIALISRKAMMQQILPPDKMPSTKEVSPKAVGKKALKNTNKKAIGKIIALTVALIAGAGGLTMACIHVLNPEWYGKGPVRIEADATQTPLHTNTKTTPKPTIKPLKNGKDEIELSLAQYGLEKIPNIANIEKVTCLDVSNNTITQITPLEKCIQMRYLSIQNNKIEDIMPVEKMQKLTYLDASNNEIQDISPLQEISGLSVLTLGGNKIEDISSISKMKGLTMLHLDNNQIVKLCSMGELENLVFLDISGNKIADFTPLYKLKQLEFLIMRNMSISSEQLEELQGELPNCEIQN